MPVRLLSHQIYSSLSTVYMYIKGNGAVYKDLNLARASRRAINRADRSCGTLTLSPCYTLHVIESS